MCKGGGRSILVPESGRILWKDRREVEKIRRKGEFDVVRTGKGKRGKKWSS